MTNRRGPASPLNCLIRSRRPRRVRPEASPLAAMIAALSIVLAHMASPAIAASGDLADVIPAYDPHLDVVKAPTGVFGTGKVWRVGPNEQYKSFSSIAKELQDGDVVEIDAGTYRCTEQSIVWTANNITVAAVGGRATFDATGCPITGDKGIFNPRGSNMIIDNIAFIGARGPSNNDSGIRLDGGGYVYVSKSYFGNSQNGILFTPTVAADIVVDHSEFSSNGNCLNPSGCGHNIYISNPQNAKSFVLRFSYSHDADTGHEVKSRAQVNYILYNRLADEAKGDASYGVDIPNGGLTYIIGNVVQKGPDAKNGNSMAYAEEPGSPNPIQKVYIVNNTIVNDVADANHRWALLLGPGVSEAEMINNLMVDFPSSDRVVDGPSAGVLKQKNNLITNSPGFYNQEARNFYLTASSPAVDAGIDPGSVNGFSLIPRYQFQFPAAAVARPVSGALDAGAYEYTPNQVVPDPPTLAFNSNSPVEFDTPVTLTWSSKSAVTCTASGEWSGSQLPSGTFTTPKLSSSKSYSLTCTGAGGTASKSLVVTVKEAPAAAALGTYSWHEIPDSSISAICAGALPEYKDNIGVGPPCAGPTTGVYVPDTETWYLMGDGGYSNYYGNEVYGFNLRTMRPELVTSPDNINKTKEFVSDPAAARDRLHLAACDTALHLASDGSIIRAPSGIEGTASWNPITKTIVVGQSIVHGIGSCRSASGDLGGVSEDLWSFSPLAAARPPVPSSLAWKRLREEDNALGSISTPIWIFDPSTGLAYTAGNRAYADRGGRLIDFRQNPPADAMVNAVWPYGAMIGAVSVDTTHHWAMVLGKASNAGAHGTIEMWNLNGLSMTKYNPKSPFAPDAGWTVVGDIDLLADLKVPGITYNPKLGAFVAWTGGSIVYFLYPDFRTKVIKILGKIDIQGGPTATNDNLYGAFTYIPEKNVYLAFSNVRNDFYLLTPPDGSNSARNP